MATATEVDLAVPAKADGSIGRCGCCGAPTYWMADFTFEDYGLEGDGIVQTSECSGCGAFIETYVRFDE